MPSAPSAVSVPCNGGEDGGYAVPTQFFGDLLDASYELEALRPRCGVIPMSSNMVVTPRFDYFLDSTDRRNRLMKSFSGRLVV